MENQDSQTIIRPATEADVEFLIDSIIAAEKSGTDRLSYCTIFGLSEPSLRVMLAEVLAEDIVGQELCVSGFNVAEIAGSPAAAACSWVEGAVGKPSALLKGNLLLHFLGRERIRAAADRLKIVEVLMLPRVPGTLQVESVYVSESHRGKGLFGQILAFQLSSALAKNPGLARAHIALMKSNVSALKAYTRAGFATIEEKQTSAPEVLELLPAASKILMEKTLC